MTPLLRTAAGKSSSNKGEEQRLQEDGDVSLMGLSSDNVQLEVDLASIKDHMFQQWSICGPKLRKMEDLYAALVIGDAKMTRLLGPADHDGSLDMEGDIRAETQPSLEGDMDARGLQNVTCA